MLFEMYCDDVQGLRAALEEDGVDVGEIQYPFYSPQGEFRVTDVDGYALIVRHT